MKKVILVLVVAAVAGIVIYKMMNRSMPPATEATEAPSESPFASKASSIAPGQSVFYLFHDPADQDSGCRRIYAFAERAERELAGKIVVRRPDVTRDKSVVEKYEVRVLPTILIVDASGTVKERFEGEEKETAARVEEMMTRLKASSQ